MGTVSLSVRMEGRFRRLCAIKRIHPHLRADPDCRAMFLEEARIAGVLSHSNIVSVIDVGEDELGPYLVMDFVEGVPLSHLQRCLRHEQQKIPLQLTLRIALDVARGLAAAHDAMDHDGAPLHIVHRDVSPQNILIGFDGTVRITDFGIARAVGRSVRTTTGLVKGKLGYMSPEQLRYIPVDHRSDLFSLGVVLYEMLAGARLYTGDGIARAILDDPPPDIGDVRRDLPPDLVALTFELLAKGRDERPRDAAVVARRLEAILFEVLSSRDPIDLRTFVRTVAGPQRARQRALLATASTIEAGGDAASEPTADGRPTGEQASRALDGTAETTPSTPSAMGTVSRTPRVATASVAIALLMALAGAVWALSTPSAGGGDGTVRVEPGRASADDAPPPPAADPQEASSPPGAEEVGAAGAAPSSLEEGPDPAERHERRASRGHSARDGRTSMARTSRADPVNPPVGPADAVMEPPAARGGMVGLQQMDWSGDID